MQFEVTRAGIGDEPVVGALRPSGAHRFTEGFVSTFEWEWARTTEDWRPWLSPGVTFILEASGEPHELVAGSRDPHEPSVVHLMAICVHPDLRDTSAADVQVSSVKTWAAEAGATQVRLNVVEGNGPVRRAFSTHSPNHCRTFGQSEVVSYIVMHKLACRRVQ
jgi:hypothetical protein